MESRAERAAKNESLFRDVNERILEATERFEAPTMSAVCECSDALCTEMISITLAEYAAVRARSDRFALVEGHEDPAVERVVERNGRFVVAEKVGDGADVARRLDPRSP